MGLEDNVQSTTHPAAGAGSQQQMSSQIDEEYRRQADRMMDAKQVEVATRALNDTRLQRLVPSGIGQMVKAINTHSEKFKNLSAAKQATSAVIKAFFDRRIAVGDARSFKPNNPAIWSRERLLFHPSFLDLLSDSRTIHIESHFGSLLDHEGGHATEPFPRGSPEGEEYARGVPKDFDAALGVNSTNMFHFE